MNKKESSCNSFSEDNGDDLEVVEEIEIGNEFKTESLTSKQLRNHRSEFNNDAGCEKNFSTQVVLGVHLKNYSQSKDNSKDRTASNLFCCNHCSYKTKQKSSLLNHMQAHHFRPSDDWNRCNKCGKSYTSKSNFNQHSRVCGLSRDSYKFCCDYCQSRFALKQNLSRHIVLKHLPRNPNLTRCKKCGKGFSTKIYLSQHNKTCGQNVSKRRLDKSKPVLSCGFCSYKSNIKQYLRRHIESKHLPQDQNLSKCKKCKKKFGNPASLYNHSKVCRSNNLELSSEHKRFSCAHCIYKTAFKSSLIQHIQSKHLPKNLNKCKKCGKCYSSEKVLSEHLKYKCGPFKKSAKCEKCGKNYSSNQSLKKHLKIVCGKMKRPSYSCNDCNYKCDEKSSLVRHMQLRHLIVWVNCSRYQ